MIGNMQAVTLAHNACMQTSPSLNGEMLDLKANPYTRNLHWHQRATGYQLME